MDTRIVKEIEEIFLLPMSLWIEPVFNKFVLTAWNAAPIKKIADSYCQTILSLMHLIGDICLKRKETALMTYNLLAIEIDNCMLSDTSKTNYNSLIPRPRTRNHGIGLIPHPTNMISELFIGCDIIVACWNWHIDKIRKWLFIPLFLKTFFHAIFFFESPDAV